MRIQRPVWSLWRQTLWGHILVAAAVVLTVAAISTLTGRYLIRQMEKIEAVAMARDVNRLRLGLQYEAWDLDTACRDWAIWSDLAQFVQSPDPLFVAENLYDSALRETLDLDLVALFDRAGRLVWGRRWAPGAQPDSDVLPMVLSASGDNPFLVGSPGDGRPGVAGIRLTPDGAMILAVRPIRERADSEPVGTLVMGRLLHARRTAWLGQRTGLKLRFRDSNRDRFSLRETTRLRDLDLEPFAVEAREQDATLYLRVPDLAGDGFLVASIAWPREQVAQGRQAAVTIAFSLFVAILLMLVALGGMLRSQARFLERSRQELIREVRERTADLEQSRQEAMALLEDANRQRHRSERALADLKTTASALRESEDRYRNLFEWSRDAMILHNTTVGVFTACNRAAMELFEAPNPEALLRQSPVSLSAPVQPEGRSVSTLADQVIQEAVREGSRTFEWTFQTLAGVPFTGLVSLVHFESDGHYLLVTIRDITQRKRLEAEREKQLKRQEILASISMLFLSGEETDTTINRALEMAGQHLGVSRAHVFSDHPSDRTWSNTHEWCRPGVASQLTRYARVPYERGSSWKGLISRSGYVAVRSAEELPSDLQAEMERGSVRALLCAPFRVAGEFVGFIGFDVCEGPRTWEPSDIHFAQTLAGLIGSVRERQALDRSLVRARDAAESANRAKSTFLANMSHEIRTPLNVILGYAQLLQRDGGLTAQQEDSIRAIARSGQHLLRMLSDILEMSRIEAGHLELHETLFDLPALLAGLEKTYRERAAAKHLALTWEDEPGLGRLWRGDEGKIRRTLENLLDNAVAYTDRGTITVRVGRAPAGAPGRLAAEVADTGRGISPADQTALFEPFASGGKPVGLGEGSGLGLAISRRFARLMGGDLTAVSEQGRGSVFRFSFNVEPVEGGDVPAAAPAAPEGPVQGLAPDQRPLRVLVADDRETSRRVLVHLLEAVGFDVRQAQDGKEALALFEADAPDVVLLDRQMPELDGLEALRRMKALRPATPVLIVTAGGLTDDRGELLAAGADGYLAKPYDEAGLFEALRRATGVAYRTADPEPVPAAAAEAAAAADVAAIQARPPEWREAFAAAARTGDIAQLTDLTEAAAAADSALGVRLRLLVNAFDYEAILKLLG